MEDIDQASQVDAGHLRNPPHGDAVDVVHDGDLGGNLVPIETPGQDRGLGGELLPALRALLVMKAIKDLLWFPGSIVDDASLRFLPGD